MNETNMPLARAGSAMRVLAIDTSTAAMSVAVLENGRLLAEKNMSAERNHSIHLVPMIGELLRSLGMAPKDLTGIGVGLGPGSYTGVRIGVTVAKTMAWTLGCPVVGVSSLEVMALGAAEPAVSDDRAVPAAPAEFQATGTSAEPAPSAASAASSAAAPGPGTSAAASCWFVPLLDARRSQVYTGLFAADSGGAGASADRGLPLPAGWTRLEPDAIRLMAGWADRLGELARTASAPPAGGIVFAGEPDAFRADIERLAEASGFRTEARPLEIRARHVGRLAWRRLTRGEADETHLLVPNYTQLAEAEAKLLAKRKEG